LKPKTINIGSMRLAVALVCLAAGSLVAACGSASSSSSSSSSTTTTTASSGSGGAGAAGGAGGNFSAQRAKLTACLKSHGVTLPSRPAGAGGAPPAGGAGSGGGTGTGTGTGTTPRRRGGFFGAAGAASNPKLAAAFKACGANFGGGRGGGFRGQLSHAAVTKYVTCVRQHGYNLPAPNFSGKGPIFPANIQSNAKFQAASKPCQSLLVPARGGAPPGGGTGTSTTSGT
jgi:hypothetical protein